MSAELTEGASVQMLHVGSFDSEAPVTQLGVGSDLLEINAGLGHPRLVVG